MHTATATQGRNPTQLGSNHGDNGRARSGDAGACGSMDASCNWKRTVHQCPVKRQSRSNQSFAHLALQHVNVGLQLLCLSPPGLNYLIHQLLQRQFLNVTRRQRDGLRH